MCLIDVSAGMDGSVWGLLCDNNVKDYKIIKWQTIQRKWYLVPGFEGVTLSALNGVSVAVINSEGLVSLSSSVKKKGRKNKIRYTDEDPGVDHTVSQNVSTPITTN